MGGPAGEGEVIVDYEDYNDPLNDFQEAQGELDDDQFKDLEVKHL